MQDDAKKEMSFDDTVEQRELAPGVILYKEYKKADYNNKDVVGLFIWRVIYLFIFYYLLMFINDVLCYLCDCVITLN